MFAHAIAAVAAMSAVRAVSAPFVTVELGAGSGLVGRGMPPVHQPTGARRGEFCSISSMRVHASPIMASAGRTARALSSPSNSTRRKRGQLEAMRRILCRDIEHAHEEGALLCAERAPVKAGGVR